MGCDIHCFLEFKYNDGQWESFSKKIRPGRDYEVFSFLAGVRGYGDIQPLVDPRGFPKDAGYDASDSYFRYVTDDFGLVYGSVPRARAESWVNSYGSYYLDDSKSRVSDPDYHSASWLTTEEFRESIRRREPIGKRIIVDHFELILAAMEGFENRGVPARLVFWFDN